jgi:hypothetical protein
MSTLDWLRAARRRPIGYLAPIALTAVLAAGCASPASTGGTAKPAAAGSAAATAGSSADSDDMSGMDMGATPDPAGSAASADGAYPVPTQVLGTAVWQGMKITADAMTPVPFLVYNGTTMQTVNPPKGTSFHLMVLLNDAQTNVVIPYASVKGTITEGSKTPFSDSLWPMISRYMGPHYGDDVALPGDGTYKLTLLVSPPVSARHLEYQGVWLKPHAVTFTFHWHQAS